MLSMLYGEEYRFGFNAAPDPLGRALQAARQAAAAAPSSHYAHLAMAQALFFRKEFDAFRNAAERAVVLNPMDGSSMEYLGHLLAFAGDWKRGCELAEKARHLNPHHPAWYWALPFLDAYRKADYVTARPFMLKADMPGQFFSRSLLAAVYGQLGEREAAEDCVREVLALKPDFPQIARDEFAKWYPPDLVEQLIEGLRKAGLDIRGEMASPTPQQRRSGSGATRRGRGLLGRGASVHVDGRGSGNHGAGGRVVRRDRHRAVALFVSPCDWRAARRDVTRVGRQTCGSSGKSSARAT